MEDQSWPDVRWSMPLSNPPRLLHLGFGQHGLRSRVEHYRLPGLWCVHFYFYAAQLRIGEETFPIEPGHASICPPDAPLEYRFRGRSRHAFAHFALPEGETVLVPAMQNLGDDFAPLLSGLEAAIAQFSAHPRRAEASLWELLWRLSERAAPVSLSPARPMALARALQIIELRGTEAPAVGELARQVGVSHNHLTRLFRAHLDTTVTGYIRARRMERARHLLLHSTLPIKAVASQVGLPDLQKFNKDARRAWGLSPRALRESMATGQTSATE